MSYLAIIYFDQDNYQKAGEDATGAASNLGDQTAALNLGIYHYIGFVKSLDEREKSEFFRQAMDYFIIAKSTKNGKMADEAYRWLAILEQKAGETDQAIKHLEKAVSINPQNTKA